VDSNDCATEDIIIENNENTENIEIACHGTNPKGIIESLLFVSAKHLTPGDISELTNINSKEVETILNELTEEYKDRGINIVNADKTYKMVTSPKYSIYVEKFLKVCSKQFLSKAALETLAIIAFKQPVTRAQIEEVRGVNIDKIVNKLLDKKLIKEAGKAAIPGKPVLYGTTKEFLHYFQLKDLDELPKTSLKEETEALEEIEHTIEEEFVHHIEEEKIEECIEENETN